MSSQFDLEGFKSRPRNEDVLEPIRRVEEDEVPSPGKEEAVMSDAFMADLKSSNSNQADKDPEVNMEEARDGLQLQKEADEALPNGESNSALQKSLAHDTQQTEQVMQGKQDFSNEKDFMSSSRHNLLKHEETVKGESREGKKEDSSFSIAEQLPLQRGQNLRLRDAVPNHPGAHSIVGPGPRLQSQESRDHAVAISSMSQLPESSNNPHAQDEEQPPPDHVLVSATLVKDATAEAFAEPVREGRKKLRVAGVAIIIMALVAIVVSLALALRSKSDSSTDEDAGNDNILPTNNNATVVTPVLHGNWDLLGDPIGGKAGNDFFGAKVALSGDGNVLVASAAGSHILAGSLKVFQQTSPGQWEPLGMQDNLVGSVPGDVLGFSVSISRDGKTVAGGAIAFGEANDRFGYVIVSRFNQTANEWQLLGDPIPGDEKGEQYGTSVSLSDDGNTIAIGAAFNNENGFEAGKATVFRYDGAGWQQLGDSKVGDRAGDELGMSVSMSGDGNMFAAGVPQFRSDVPLPGYVRVYRIVEDTWVQVGDDLLGEAVEDEFGWLVALSRSGTSLAVSAFEGRSFRGAAYVFEYSPSGTWDRLGQVLEGKRVDDSYGLAMDFSADGRTLAAGSWRKDATAEYPVYTRVFRLAENRTVWNQLGKDLERLDPQLGGLSVSYGLALALSDDGNTLAVGSMHEEIDDAGGNSGAVSLYRFVPAG